MNGLYSSNSAERAIARIMAYNANIGIHCELCAWTPPCFFDPETMDYQCFATWPMLLPEESHIRDVTLCRVCFDIASDFSPAIVGKINNPEEEEDHDEFEGFDYNYNQSIFHIENIGEEVKEYVPQETTPAMAALLAALPLLAAGCSDPNSV
jgi:hypothetical protein